MPLRLRRGGSWREACDTAPTRGHGLGETTTGAGAQALKGRHSVCAGAWLVRAPSALQSGSSKRS